MTLQDAIDQMRLRIAPTPGEVGDPTGAVLTRKIATSLLDRAQRRVARESGALLTSTTISTVSGTAVYDLPGNFLEDVAVLGGVPGGTTWVLKSRTLNWQWRAGVWVDAEQAAGAEAPSGDPRDYSIQGDPDTPGALQIMLSPIPARVVTLKLEYIAQPDPLQVGDLSFSMPDEYHDSILSVAMAEVARIPAAGILDQVVILKREATEALLESKVITSRRNGRTGTVQPTHF